MVVIAPDYATAGGGLVAEYLSHAQFTTRVNNRKPVNDLNSLSTKFKKIYFFTDIRGCEDCDIEHQWWHKGNKVSAVESETTSNRYRWWTSKTLNANSIGEWTVKVYIDDDYVYSKSLRYYIPTKKQRQASPVIKRLDVKESDDCEIQLRYFSDKVEKNPKEPYFKFMLKKWGKRCLGE